MSLFKLNIIMMSCLILASIIVIAFGVIYQRLVTGLWLFTSIDVVPLLAHTDVCPDLSVSNWIKGVFLHTTLTGGSKWEWTRCTTEWEVIMTHTVRFDYYTALLFYFCLLSCFIACSLSLYLEFNKFDPIGRSWSSILISLLTFKRSNKFATCTVRSQFMSCPDVKNGKARNHTHPVAAQVRNNGSSFMDLFSKLIGKETYFLQRSAADIRHNRAGCRSYHWAKDLSVRQDRFDPSPLDLLCLVDVDMYMDIPALLCHGFQPVLISTFQPSCVAKSEGEYCFTFDKNDIVQYDVSGGAHYSHKVWNYGTDVVMAVSKSFGITYVNTYNVDRRYLDDDHQLILLTPIEQIITPWWNPTWLKGDKVEYMKVAETVDDKTYLRLSVKTKERMMRSTGRPETYLCATIEAKRDDALASIARSSKSTDLTIAGVKTVLKDCEQEQAAILTEYHNCKRGIVPDVIYPIDKSVFNFQYDPKEYDPDAKPSLKPYMSPVILGCYAPVQCKSNDQAAINGRINDVKPSDDITVSAKMLMYMEEFLSFMIPTPHVGHPVDFDTVHEKQNRPSQRAILKRAGLVAALKDDSPIQSFQKAEAYGKITDPRIISTIPGVAKYNYSRYIYSFTKVLRQTKWYAFAITPIEIARRVASICLLALYAIMTDLSRFDGRVSIVLRTLEKLAMLRYFAIEYHKELAELMASQQNQRAYTKFGVKYGTGFTRASGSPETADFNSMDNAFMAYVSLRKTIRDGRPVSAQEAWDGLGIYGGDDGITADVDPNVYVATCSEVGQVLELDIVKRGESGVTFLARTYSLHVWHGATDSICDIGRQLSKLHVTPSLPITVTPLQKLCEKLYSYYLTDRNTPIIGQLATMVVTVFPELVPKDHNANRLASYYSLVPEEVQYPNNDSADNWMISSVKASLPDFNFDTFNAWLALVTKLKDSSLLLKAPLCASYDITFSSKVPVVVNGVVVEPIPTTEIKSDKPKVRKEYTAEQLAKMSTEPCKSFIAGNCMFKKCRFKHAKV
jgi:hypothetical protein